MSLPFARVSHPHTPCAPAPISDGREPPETARVPAGAP
jgi:hypothetical protein